jgi:hypothetical protein
MHWIVLLFLAYRMTARDRMELCQRSSALGRAPTLEIRNEFVFGNACCPEQRVKLSSGLFERRPLRLGTFASGGYEVSDRISMPGDGDRTIAFQQARREVFTKVPNAYRDGLH